MTNEYSYGFADLQTIEPSQIRTNMTYDAAPRTPEADEPVILNMSGANRVGLKADALAIGGQRRSRLG
jgi:hypothetical protein